MQTDFEKQRKHILMSYLSKRLTIKGKNLFDDLVQNLSKDDDQDNPDLLRAELNLLAI